METLEYLTKQGYHGLRTVPGRKWCGLMQMIGYWGLFYGMDQHGREGHYVYNSFSEAVLALAKWNGEGDPSGKWMEHKGGKGQYFNPGTYVDTGRQIKLLVLMLRGGNTPEDRVKSYRAFAEFKNAHELYNDQLHYTDSKGFAVFCLALLVTDQYQPDTFVKSWEAICDHFGVKGCADSYENLLSFHEAVDADYILKKYYER